MNMWQAMMEFFHVTIPICGFDVSLLSLVMFSVLCGGLFMALGRILNG